MAPALVLVPLCTIELTLGEMQVVGDGPSGSRLIVHVGGGVVSGERLSGQLHPAGMADWVTVNGTVASVDVRGTIDTDDGALVYVSYGGRFDITNGPGSSPIYVAPRFETSDGRYTWLNLVQAVGVGTLTGDRLHHEWFEATVPDAVLLDT